jgi:hypothetical protein
MLTNGRRRGQRRWRKGTAGLLRSGALVEEAAAPARVLDPGAGHRGQPRPGAAARGGASGGLAGRALPSLAYPPDEELAGAAVQQVLDEGLDRCQVDALWVRLSSRELVWGTFDLSLVRDRRSRPELAIAMVRDLTAVKRSEHERRFFEFMFKLIGEADFSHEVLAAAVQTICHFTRCAMGQVWLPAGKVLVCSPSWYCSGYGFEKLHVASEEIDYQLGQGLPGLAWAKRQPLLLEDIREPGRFDRAGAAQRVGSARPWPCPWSGPTGWWRSWSCSSPTSGPASRAAWSGSPGSPRSSPPWSVAPGLRDPGRLPAAVPGGHRGGGGGRDRVRRQLEAAADLEPRGRAAVRLDGHRGRRQAADHDHPRAVPPAAQRRDRPGPVYMQQLIHDLIDLSRVGRSGVEPVEIDLGPLVRAIAEDAGAAHPGPSSGSGASRW